jgi:adenosylcobinamide amidohydrolase
MEDVRSELTQRREAGVDLPVLIWRPIQPVLTISSGPLGGGIGLRHWVLNATVPVSYARDDPSVHVGEIAAGLGLTGPGAGLLTGVDVGRAVTVIERGVTVSATVGIGDPGWAAAPDTDLVDRVAGTINVVAWLPARLAEAALVNAVATIAEAKAQAFGDLAIAGTGTCTDAVVVTCPAVGPAEPYGGPRSAWGAPLARAVHAAVVRGGRAWLADPRSWSARTAGLRAGADIDGNPFRGGGTVPGSGNLRTDPSRGLRTKPE